MRRILVTLRNEPGMKIDLVYVDEGETPEYWLQKVGDVFGGQDIHLQPHEFINLMRAGLENLKVTRSLIDTIFPKITKANIVK